MKKDPISNYLMKRADLAGRPLISGPVRGVDQIVVIPALAELETLFLTLESLCANPSADLARTLVVCVVNNRSPSHVDKGVIENNQTTVHILDKVVRGEIPPDYPVFAQSPLRLGYIDASSPGCELPPKDGVGLARKLGMDWGLEVLRGADSPVRLLFCLDADTQVERAYLPAVRRFFEAHNAWAAVVAYAHAVEESGPQLAGILCYELFLRYHVMGLRYAGSPYAFPSIGSTMVCRAEAYAAVSGMNRRLAGEDFYFLEKLAKTGGVSQIHTTTVRPASRPGRRTPFGTGQRVRRFMEARQGEYRAYHPESYEVLKNWLDLVSARFDQDGGMLENEASRVSPALKTFLEASAFARAWDRIRKNTADPRRLGEQFHRWFDGLKTLRLIHHLRDTGLPDQDLFGAIGRLLDMVGAHLFMPDPARMHGDLEAQRALLDYLRTEAGDLK